MGFKLKQLDFKLEQLDFNMVPMELDMVIMNIEELDFILKVNWMVLSMDLMVVNMVIKQDFDFIGEDIRLDKFEDLSYTKVVEQELPKDRQAIELMEQHKEEVKEFSKFNLEGHISFIELEQHIMAMLVE